MMKIGFIGVGSMGRYMAASLIRAGHELLLFDLREEAKTDPVLAGAAWARSPGDLSAAVDCVITSLPGPQQIQELVLAPGGVLASLKAGGLYIDMSTSTPEKAREVAAAAEACGIAAIDAPVSGGPRGARKATLTIMAGGSEKAYEQALPVLKCMGEKIFLVGGPGAGHVAKLVNNMMGLTNGIAAMEAMVVGTKAGVNPAKLLEVVRAGAGDSFVLNMMPYVVFKRAFEPAKFALALAAKDLRLSVEYADALGVPVNIVRHACAALAGAVEEGLGEEDWASYIKLIEAGAGVEVRP
jgi:3-hydroxyisobutyrate dehydrogenase